jgi:hypothetical protein
MCYTCCVQSCRIGGAGGVFPPPWRPSARARPFPPEAAPASCSGLCYGRPVPRRATSCERRRHTAEAEPLGVWLSGPRRPLSRRELPIRSAVVRPHGPVEAGLVLSGSLSLGIPPAAVATCALTVSASAAVAGVAWAARRQHGPAPRAWSTSSLGSRGDASATDRPEAGAVSPGRLPSGKPPTNESRAPGHAVQTTKAPAIHPTRPESALRARRLLRLKLTQVAGAGGRVREYATLDHGRENTGVQPGKVSGDQSPD